MNDPLPNCPRCKKPPLVEEIGAGYTLACGRGGSHVHSRAKQTVIRCVTDRGRCYIKVEAPTLRQAEIAWRELVKEAP